MPSWHILCCYGIRHCHAEGAKSVSDEEMKSTMLGIQIAVKAPSQPPAVLLLEDHGEIQRLITAILETRSVSCDSAPNLVAARLLMVKRKYDILFVDVNLPDGSGLSLVADKAREGPVTVVMTGAADVEIAIGAIRAGAFDFIAKPFTTSEFLSRFDRAREEWRSREKLFSYSGILETMVRIQSVELRESTRHRDEVRDMTVASLGAALNLKDHETADHCLRVSQNSARLGRLLALSDAELRSLTWGAYLHDVGKIGIPEAILLKTGALTPQERRVMEKHPLMGEAILSRIEFLAESTPVVLSHHERYDGLGYPCGLQGVQIPLCARIFSLLDSLDAMTSRRPYRAPLPLSQAMAELEGAVGKQFDPDIASVFLRAPTATWLVQDREAAGGEKGLSA